MTDQGVTKARFIAEGNRACEKALREKDRAVQHNLESAGANLGNSSRAKSLAYLAQNVVIPVYEEVPNELRNLGAPSGDEQQVQNLVASYEAALRVAENDPTRLIESNPFEAADKSAQAYGLTACVL